MMILRRLFVGLFFFLTFLNAVHADPPNFTKVILVSDIDDTLQMTLVKPTSLRDVGRFLLDLFKSHDSFVGLSPLYNFLNAKGIEIHYVSGAPERIRTIPDKFLQTSAFPVDQLWLRPNLDISTQDFKVQKIKDLIAENPNAAFIFVGDNGEMDTLVYHEIAKLYPEKVLATYIHKLYAFGNKGPGKPLEENQTSYITGAELALSLKNLGFLTAMETKTVLKHVSSAVKGLHRAVRLRVLPRYAKIEQSDEDYLRHLKQQEGHDPEMQAMIENVIQGMELHRANQRQSSLCLFSLQGTTSAK